MSYQIEWLIDVLLVSAALAVDVSPASQTISVGQGGQGGQDRIILDCRVRGNVPAQVRTVEPPMGSFILERKWISFLVAAAFAVV